jgi:hypothetical protein
VRSTRIAWERSYVLHKGSHQRAQGLEGLALGGPPTGQSAGWSPAVPPRTKASIGRIWIAAPEIQNRRGHSKKFARAGRGSDEGACLR